MMKERGRAAAPVSSRSKQLLRPICAALGAAALTVTALAVPAHAAVSPPPPRLPVMGVNTWYEYRTAADEADVLDQARLLVSTGLAAEGYDFVDLDDGWMSASRTSAGALTWDTSKFPDGIPWLAATLQSMGLKLGIYTAIGSRTCQNFPGSWGHYAQDAATFASWGVDLVKVDSCGGMPSGTTEAAAAGDFSEFGADLKGDNPNVVYSQELPVPYIGTAMYGPAVQASRASAYDWRVAEDESTVNSASYTIMYHLTADWHLHGYAGPGHWNDLDMLLTGNPAYNWSLAEDESQLSVWAEEASPLLVSTDLATLSPAQLAALGNKHLIAIDQSGAQAADGISVGHVEGLVKPDPEGGMAVLLANDGTGTASAKFSLAQVGLTARHAEGDNIWTGRTTGFTGVAVTLGAGQTELIRMWND